MRIDILAWPITDVETDATAQKDEQGRDSDKLDGRFAYYFVFHICVFSHLLISAKTDKKRLAGSAHKNRVALPEFISVRFAPFLHNCLWITTHGSTG